MRPVMLAVLALTVLSACQTGSGDTSVPAAAPEGKADTCGASEFAAAIGTAHADHDFADPGRPLRIIPPMSAITMDHNPSRLNVDLDEDGKVLRLWCG